MKKNNNKAYNPYQVGDTLTLDGKRVRIVARNQNSCQVKTEIGLIWIDWKELSGSLQCICSSENLSNIYEVGKIYVPTREIRPISRKIEFFIKAGNRQFELIKEIETGNLLIECRGIIYARFEEAKNEM